MEYCEPQAPLTQLRHSAEALLPSGALQLPEPELVSEPPQAATAELASKLNRSAKYFFMTGE